MKKGVNILCTVIFKCLFFASECVENLSYDTIAIS